MTVLIKVIEELKDSELIDKRDKEGMRLEIGTRGVAFTVAVFAPGSSEAIHLLLKYL